MLHTVFFVSTTLGDISFKSTFNVIYKPHLILQDNSSQIRRVGMVIKICTFLFSGDGVFKLSEDHKKKECKLAKSPRGVGLFFAWLKKISGKNPTPGAFPEIPL